MVSLLFLPDTGKRWAQFLIILILNRDVFTDNGLPHRFDSRFSVHSERVSFPDSSRRITTCSSIPVIKKWSLGGMKILNFDFFLSEP